MPDTMTWLFPNIENHDGVLTSYIGFGSLIILMDKSIDGIDLQRTNNCVLSIFRPLRSVSHH